MRLKNKRREHASQLLAEARFNHKKIAELVGVSLASITKWKRRPEVRERIAELAATYTERVFNEGLALKANRLAELNELHEKAVQIIAERAADPDLALTPGGKTGLVVRYTKVIGKQVYVSYAVDTKLIKEMRAISEQYARETGQWQERIEVEDVSLADVLAKARLRKPAPVSEPIVVEIAMPVTDLPN